MIRKLVGFLVVGLLVFFVITQPIAAARVATSLKETAEQAGNAFSTFLVELT